MKEIKKIIIYLPNLKGGGAEKVYLNLANHWVSQGINVVFLLNKKEGDYLQFVNKKIKIIDLKINRIRQGFLKLPFIFKKEKASICIAAMWPLTSIVIILFRLFFIKTKLIVSDHVNLEKSILKETSINLNLFKFILKITYPFADGIICVSKGVKSQICKITNIKSNKIKVIYNPIIKDEKFDNLFNLKKFKKFSKKTVLSVGTLKEQKNHKFLINVFSKIDKNIDAQLIILGSGPLKNKLNNLIKNLNETKRIFIIDFDTNVLEYYLKSHIFVLSSEWEGFGNVIVEAMYCGLDVISSNCDYGPEEILENGKYGAIYRKNNENELLTELNKLINKKEFIFNEKNYLRSFEFSISKISKQYINYFNQIL